MGSTLQHEAGRSTVPLQDVGNTSKPVDDKEATSSRDSELANRHPQQFYARNLSRMWCTSKNNVINLQRLICLGITGAMGKTPIVAVKALPKLLPLI